MQLHKKRCTFCGKRVILARRGKAPLTMYATVEHIYDRSDIRRGLVSENQNTTLACWGCNQKRNDCRVNDTISDYRGIPRISLTETLRTGEISYFYYREGVKVIAQRLPP